MKSNKSATHRRLLRLADQAIQGSLSLTTRTCGNPRCACRTDPAQRHGPHLYLTFRTSDGRSSALYVPPEHETEIRQAVAAWAELWETIVTLSHANRDRLRQTMRRRPPRTPA
jgi:hypothetical protein